MTRAVIALGSNLGDRVATLRAAVQAIDAVSGVRVLRASGLVESAALKPDGIDETSPHYLNAVLLADVAIDPLELLAAVNQIEHEHGRTRDTQWGDRTLDLDLITFGTLEQHSERLTLPHPLAWQRAFVLSPWLQLEPDAVIPGRGPVAELLVATDDAVWEFAADPLFVADSAAAEVGR